MDFNQFKNDCSKLNVFDFMKKWENHPNYKEYEQMKYDNDFYEYICEEYNYDSKKINEWKIFKNTCELYVNLKNK